MRWLLEARMERRKAEKCILRHLCHLKNSELEPQFQKYNGRLVLRGDIVKDDSGSCAVITEHQRHKWRLQKSWIQYQDYQDAQDKQQTQYPLTPGQNVRCTNVMKNSRVRMSRYLDTSTKTRMALIMVQYGRPSRSSWAKSVWSSFGRTVMGKAIWENPIEVRLGEGFPLGMFIRTPWKRIILICVCGWHKIGWKETKSWSDVESTDQISWFGRNNIFPWSCIPGMYSKTMWNKQRYCGQLQSHVWITNFRRENWKTSILREFSYLFVVLWYGRSRTEMCGTILWVGKQDDSTTLQSIYSMPQWPPI